MPFLCTKLRPTSSHFAGGKVAREKHPENEDLGTSSLLHRRSFTLRIASSCETLRRKATRLARGSIKVSWRSGRNMARGMPGRPPPEPTSANTDSLGRTALNAKLSTKCSLNSSCADFAPVRLMRAFHSSSRLAYANRAERAPSERVTFHSRQNSSSRPASESKIDSV
jgi:hypothetical protein